MIYNHVSMKTVIAKIYRDLNINYELSDLDMYEWASEALSMIGAFSQYEEITTKLEFKNGKACLPLGFEKLVNIEYCGKPLFWSTNTNRHNYACDGCNIPNYSDGCCQEGYNFYIKGGYVISDIDCQNKDKVTITYLGLPTDEDGYPLVPDDVYYIKAVAAYIIHMLDKQEWRKGNIADKVMQKSETDWLFYVNSARGSANMPNLAQLENLKNTLRRMIPVSNDYLTGFKRFNQIERIKRNGRY